MSLPPQKAKMLAGERYNCLDPELAAERTAVKALLRQYNTAVDDATRHALLPQLLCRVGQGSFIEAPFHCSYGRNLYLGDHVYFNFNCVVLDNNRVEIGNHVMLGPAVQLYTAVHPLEAEERIAGWEVALPIVIQDNVWLGGGAIVLPGVTIGRNAVVGAGAVVTRDVPPDVVVVGNPARIVRTIT